MTRSDRTAGPSVIKIHTPPNGKEKRKYITVRVLRIMDESGEIHPIGSGDGLAPWWEVKVQTGDRSDTYYGEEVPGEGVP